MNHIKPFKICGNIYFVGTEPASSHLIATEEGLILLDSGYPHTLHHVIESIWELGFDLRDIRHVIHSHGHYDHLGATGHLLELTHAETFLGADDIDYANGTLDLTWARELGFAYTETFEPDHALHDGDIIRLVSACRPRAIPPEPCPFSSTPRKKASNTGRPCTAESASTP